MAKHQALYNVISKDWAITQVKAERVQLPGLERLDFIIHRPVNGKNGWSVSELTTGRVVRSYTGRITKSDALDRIRSFVLQLGPGEMDRALQHGREENERQGFAGDINGPLYRLDIRPADPAPAPAARLARIDSWTINAPCAWI